MKMTVLVKRLEIALGKIKKIHADPERLKQFKPATEITSQAILFKLERLIDKYKDVSDPVTVTNADEFYQLVRTHFDITVETNAFNFSHYDSLNNVICETIACELHAVLKNEDDKFSDPWKILIPTLEMTKSEVTGNHLPVLSSMVDKKVDVAGNEKVDKELKRWEIVLSSNHKYFIEIYRCLNKFLDKGLVHTAVSNDIDLDVNEKLLVTTHSKYAKAYYDKLLLNDDDSAGRDSLKKELKNALKRHNYEIADIYGETGDQKLIANLLRAKNYFFNSTDKLGKESLFTFFTMLPKSSWQDAKTILNITAEEMYGSLDKFIEQLQQLQHLTMDWQEFLRLFADDLRQTLRVFLAKSIDPKQWLEILSSFDLQLSDVFSNPREFIHYMPKQHWQIYKDTFDQENKLFADFSDLVCTLHRLNEEGEDRKELVSVFNVDIKKYYYCRDSLIHLLKTHNHILAIHQWPKLFNTLGIKYEELFSNAAEMTDLLLRHLPVNQWKDFINAFSIKVEDVFGKPGALFAAKHLAKGNWQLFLKDFNYPKEDMFENAAGLFKFMEDQQDRQNWDVLLTNFDKKKLGKLLFNVEVTKEVLREAPKTLNITQEDNMHNLVREYCSYKAYWNWREDQGFHTSNSAYIAKLAGKVSNIEEKKNLVDLMLEFFTSRYPRTAQGFESFLCVTKAKKDTDIQELKKAYLESYTWYGDSILCTYFKNTMNLNVKAESTNGWFNMFGGTQATPPVSTQVPTETPTAGM